jgi:hypothetical protein
MEDGKHTGAAIAIFLRLPGYELFLGEAELIDKRVEKALSGPPSILLKFSRDVLPKSSGFADWEQVIPLQAVAELPDKNKGEGTGSLGVGGNLNHTEPPEIEITPEMIKAGVNAYRKRDSRFMRDADIVEEIYLSMTEAA